MLGATGTFVMFPDVVVAEVLIAGDLLFPLFAISEVNVSEESEDVEGDWVSAVSLSGGSKRGRSMDVRLFKPVSREVCLFRLVSDSRLGN